MIRCVLYFPYNPSLCVLIREHRRQLSASAESVSVCCVTTKYKTHAVAMHPPQCAIDQLAA